MSAAIQVLHVDDEPGFADLSAEFLERESDRFTVRTATTAEDGLDILRRHDIDCIVSDHDMPGMDGIEFLSTIREDNPELPFILFTGKGSEEVASKAVSAGVTDYLQKESGTDHYTLLANRIRNSVERYRSQRAVQQQKRRLETLVSNLPGIVYRCQNEPGWPMEEVEGECERLTGYQSTTLEAGAVVWGEDVIHPVDQGKIWNTVQDALDAREPFQCTYRIQTADDDTKWMWERGRGVYTSAGEVDALEGFITDITELKQREQELREHERRFEAIFNDPNLLVGLLEPDGTTRDVNETAVEYVDTARSAITGEAFWETPWWPDEHREDVKQWIDDAASGEYVEYEATHPVGDGRQATVEGNFRPVTDDDGTVTTIVVSANDVTERKQRERELKRHNERFDEFASFVSHDLQTPISTVRGRLELALETDEMTHVERATEAIERVDDLRADLVNTLQTGEIVSETETVAIDSVMADVWAAIDPPDTASFTVVDSTRIEADVDALQRMLENLVGNSIEHGGENVDILIGRFEPGLYYEDSGPGIDPSNREQVFTPGFSTKKGEEGIGMGMASVRQIVLAHGWEVSIEDAETLDGVRFEISTD